MATSTSRQHIEQSIAEEDFDGVVEPIEEVMGDGFKAVVVEIGMLSDEG
jgi:hypothetical protein